MREYQGKSFTYFETLQEAEEHQGTEFCIAEMPNNSWFSFQNNTYKIKTFNSTNQMMICQDENGQITHLDSTENALYLGIFNSKFN